MRTFIGFCGFEILCNVFSYQGCLNMVQMGVCSARLIFFSFLLVRVNGRDFPLVVIRFPSSGLRYSICSYICVCADCRLFFFFCCCFFVFFFFFSFFSAVDEGEVGWDFFRMFNKFIHVGIF